ncbi:esterase FE4-like [Zerene cesonia]|uniref:esterase FE4-like n=1 Tax=Zerene cesonia TaxID=33412 RepID=UPI0018E583B4|nr:esterase FE4-like [Zerene cesonia]XP_038219785.1 esterase FE4-like [Zerene cesonia]
MAPQIVVAQGIMRGKECTTPCGKRYYSFEGIPYAKPPVGDLRFRDPQKPEPWSGVLDATKPGNKAIQLNAAGGIEGSEDCLYLNVYTPSLPSEKIEKLPVLFFVHGGRFLVGYGDYYRPDYLIRHDIVIVTINYRLSIFGFLCLHTPVVPGNAGAKDTIMALRWVKNNIGNFNGDDGNIVGCGESAGACIVDSYLTSKMADGLISKVICQSASLLSDLYLINEDYVGKAKEIAKNMGEDISDTSELFDFFSKASVEDLIYAYTMCEVNRDPFILNSFLLPVVERKFENVEAFFDEYPLESIRNNRYKKLPKILTAATHEAALFIQRHEDGSINFNRNLRKFIPRYSFIDTESSRAYKIEKRLRELYFKDANIEMGTLEEYLTLISDTYFLRDIMYEVETFSQNQNDLYLCRFDYPGSMNTRVMKKLGFNGTTHGDLIQYIFYKEKKAKLCTESDMKVVDMLTEAWCNFAKTGKPTWRNQEVDWLPYLKNRRLCLNLAQSSIQCVPIPEYERVKVWFDLIGQRSKL